MEPEVSLPHSQVPATFLFPEPAYSLAAAVSEPALYRLLTFQLPNPMALFHFLARTSPYQSRPESLVNISYQDTFLTTSSSWHLAQPPSWRTTSSRLSATAYSIYSQLPSILEAVSPSATWGFAMLWWQGPTYHGVRAASLSIIQVNVRGCCKWTVSPGRQPVACTQFRLPGYVITWRIAACEI